MLLEGETVWLTQAQIAELYQTTPQNVTQHLKAIYDEGELAESATCKDYLQVPREGKREVSRRLKHYRLEVILAVGYTSLSTATRSHLLDSPYPGRRSGRWHQQWPSCCFLFFLAQVSQDPVEGLPRFTA